MANSREKWTGPFRFVSIEGETVVVQLSRAKKILRTTVVKPAVGSVWNSEATGRLEEIKNG